MKINNKISYCKSCFSIIKQNSFNNIFDADSKLCNNCFKQFEIINKKLEVENIKGFVLYKYNEFFKEKLYVLKGCYDIEMAPIFLDKFKFIFRLIYKGYEIVPAPSFEEANNLRGFKHLNEIFKILNLNIIDFFYKKHNIKQSDLNFEKRYLVKENIFRKENMKLSGKKILFVDDVYTSGNTLKTCLKILKKEKVKKIKFLILSSKYLN